mgnify:CR=1 FL=1
MTSEGVVKNLKAKNKENEQQVIAHPSFATAFKFWLKLGFISFGGPAGQISIMHHELVDRKRWVSNERFLNALNYCMLLPGPEAQQLATYIGWLLHRLPGGIVAGAFFVIPSIFILFALSYIYAAYGTVPWVAAVFNGLKAAIMAIVVAAVIKIGKKALKNGIMVAIAALSFIAIFILKVPFPLIVLGAGLLGLVGRYAIPAKFDVIKGKDAFELPPRKGEHECLSRWCETQKRSFHESKLSHARTVKLLVPGRCGATVPVERVAPGSRCARESVGHFHQQALAVRGIDEWISNLLH